MKFCIEMTPILGGKKAQAANNENLFTTCAIFFLRVINGLENFSRHLKKGRFYTRPYISNNADCG
ncbi:hypothetical protein FACS1894199_14660 [Bacteroidia bacterium]|nr:hypothetical protein FACS1894199_14660 [Bacteroidia bacterium]